MLRKAVLAAVVGVVTWVVIRLIGALLVDAHVLTNFGTELKAVAFLLGVAAAVWYYFTGQTPNRAV